MGHSSFSVEGGDRSPLAGSFSLVSKENWDLMAVYTVMQGRTVGKTRLYISHGESWMNHSTMLTSVKSGVSEPRTSAFRTGCSTGKAGFANYLPLSAKAYTQNVDKETVDRCLNSNVASCGGICLACPYSTAAEFPVHSQITV